MSSSFIRIFWSLLVHIGFISAAVGLIYLIGGSETALAEATRAQYADNPATLEDIRSASIAELILWAMLALAVSWILSSLWLVIAERQRPRTPVEGASKKGSWVLMLVLCLMAMAVIGWMRIWRGGLEVDLATDTLTFGMIIIGISVFAAYFLGTAMSVKTVMRPSVPFSNFLPSFSKGKT
jgi:uncharacterized membrane protein (DUF485 family)